MVKPYEKLTAVVGVGGIFPGAPTLPLFWKNILEAKDVSAPISPDRWVVSPNAVYTPGGARKDRLYSRNTCSVRDFEFDPSGYSVQPDELMRLDPVFHLALHAGKQAVESVVGGICPERTSVIIGNIVLPTEKASALTRQYLAPVIAAQLDCDAAVSVDRPDSMNRYAAGYPRGILTRALGLGNGGFALDAACASSLYAIHIAIDLLQHYRADAVLTGGVSRPDSLYTQMGFSQLRALSPSGKCSPFDARADGLIVGEGAGMFVLKRLEDAIRDKDNISAVIRGSGISNDIRGNIMAPDSEGQLRALRQAYQYTDISPYDIDFIECHATGTPKGDAVEFHSLLQLWNDPEKVTRKCVLGAVKSNVGHLLTGAGAAGVMKLLLAFSHKMLPPNANFHSPGKTIPLSGSPFRILKEAVPWKRRNPKTPRRAAVNAFGFGGINAHLIFEEWDAALAIQRKESLPIELVTPDPEPVAVVGAAACFGAGRALNDLADHLFSVRGIKPVPWHLQAWGGTADDWGSAGKIKLSAYPLREFQIPLGKYRIPPRELAEMLPQQLLMLHTASQAVADSRWDAEKLMRTGVFVGISLDMNTTNFQFRWWLPELAKQCFPDADPDNPAFGAWVEALRDAFHPPLNANRTMGALGGIVASRIARHLKTGGPAFSISSGELSGIHALITAVQALQNHRIDQALAGAVDLACDFRAVLAAHDLQASPSNPLPTLPGDGAGAVVLKRLSDAYQDGDTVYCIIKGIGTASGHPGQHNAPPIDAMHRAIHQALQESHADPLDIRHIERFETGNPIRDKTEADLLSDIYMGGDSAGTRFAGIHSVNRKIGHTGAASGFAAFLSACLHISGEVLTAPKPCYWVRNRAKETRRAAVNAFSMDGTCAHIILEGISKEQTENQRKPYVPEPPGVLFLFESGDIAGLKQSLEALESNQRNRNDGDIFSLSRAWYDANPLNSALPLGLSVYVESMEELRWLLPLLIQGLETGEVSGKDNGRAFLQANGISGMVFVDFSPCPGKTAFVYPGSGNHYPGMGRELSAAWPEIFRTQDAENRFLSDQFAPETVWTAVDVSQMNTRPAELIRAQVSHGIFQTELLKKFNVAPDAAIGYSLGETTALFALGAWPERDEMFLRMKQSTLFTEDLAGPCRAAAATWDLEPGKEPDWIMGVADISAGRIKQALARYDKVYLMIINSPEQCVIGGFRPNVELLGKELGFHFHKLPGVTTVHCEVVRRVEAAYRDLHRLKTIPVPDVEFYSAAWAKPYSVTTDSAADSITAQAVDGFDFTRVISAAYRNGVRRFLEAGPGSSCTRMIRAILKDKPHTAVSIAETGRETPGSFIRFLGKLHAARIPFDPAALFHRFRSPQRTAHHTLSVFPHRHEFNPPPPPELHHRQSAPADSTATSPSGTLSATRSLKYSPKATAKVTAKAIQPHSAHSEHSSRSDATPAASVPSGINLARQMALTEAAISRAHAAFLDFSKKMHTSVSQAIQLQIRILEKRPESGLTPVPKPEQTSPEVFMDYAACMEFAVGSIAAVLGEEYAVVDTFPTRVRLPDDPLMLVHRILSVQGEPRSLGSGQVITAHDILHDAWYLDSGRIPTCIAVEAGQADLFLSGYLGIDFVTRGLAVYRLLDAEITFHDHLAGPGKTILYDIHIDNFFRQGDVHLFRFRFDATVDGKPFLSMRKGCAGFFTEAELAAGKGIVQPGIANQVEKGIVHAEWSELVPMQAEAYSDAQLDALRRGDLAACFGPAFQGLPLRNPPRLPTGRMTLIHRVKHIAPRSGKYGLGSIRAAADIHPDDWFLTCHFKDDKVMPGTLMYECCLHTFRVFLMRMGWIDEQDQTAWEPVPGVKSSLKCRGQVTVSTRSAEYEIEIREIGYNPAPYAIADAMMYADGRPVVEMRNMSLQLHGSNRRRVHALWNKEPGRGVQPVFGHALFDRDKILAFAVGNPSEAFGDRYRVFDRERIIARLPGPPYQFLDRIVSIQNARQWEMEAGGEIVAEYDVPGDAWYFSENGIPGMPYSVLLEIALQPCGWFAAYLGSALTSNEDLSFRNLGGRAVLHRHVTPGTGTLTTRVNITKVSTSGGMIIQNYDFEVQSSGGPVFTGDTYFGFFTKSALAQQIGIRDKKQWESAPLLNAFAYPAGGNLPGKMLCMMDRITHFEPDGGPERKGFIQGIKQVNPEEWFFRAHFYQDPVWPGSLGLEALIQLLKFVAMERWGKNLKFRATAPGKPHEWVYRGQVIPRNKEVIVQAIITSRNDEKKILTANGTLSVDGKVIYTMTDFSVAQWVD